MIRAAFTLRLKPGALAGVHRPPRRRSGPSSWPRSSVSPALRGHDRVRATTAGDLLLLRDRRPRFAGSASGRAEVHDRWGRELQAPDRLQATTARSTPATCSEIFRLETGPSVAGEARAAAARVAVVTGASAASASIARRAGRAGLPAPPRRRPGGRRADRRRTARPSHTPPTSPTPTRSRRSPPASAPPSAPPPSSSTRRACSAPSARQGTSIPQAWIAALLVNAVGPFRTVRAFVPGMIDAGLGADRQRHLRRRAAPAGRPQQRLRDEQGRRRTSSRATWLPRWRAPA